MTVTRLRREMPEAEFQEWIGFYRWEAEQAEKARKEAEKKRK